MIMSDQTIAPDQTAAAVPALYDAFARRDLRAGLACMAATSSGTRRRGCRGAAHTGPGAVAQGVFAPALERIRDLAVTPEEMVTSGDTVNVVHR
jgi:ketosteroid isomerase-like protein